jgi:hypothetical protein
MIVLLAYSWIICVLREGEAVPGWTPHTVLVEAGYTTLLIWGGFLTVVGPPQVMYGVLWLCGFWIRTRGTRGNYSIGGYLIGCAIVCTLYYWGGFWTNGAVF